MNVNLGDFDNAWYKPGKNLLVRVVWFFINSVIFQSSIFPISKVKVILLKLFGSKVGTGVVIKPNVNIKYPWKLTIGSNVWVGEQVWIDNLDEVVIGNNCCLSQGSMLLCGNHDFTSRKFDLITKPIMLHDGAWVGAKAIVCPGITLEENSILTVGSVANKSLSRAGIYSGNPAVLKKKRTIN